MSKDTKRLIIGGIFAAVGSLIVSLLTIAAATKDAASAFTFFKYDILGRFGFMGEFGSLIILAFFFIGLLLFIIGLVILIIELRSCRKSADKNRLFNLMKK